MDIRHFDDRIIRFADNDGGTTKATRLEKVVPAQFKIYCDKGTYLTIERRDLPAFRKALKYAEEMWNA